MEKNIPKKKILFRNRSLEMGGIENVLLTILDHLDQSKFEITLLLNYEQGEFIGRVPEGVRVLSIGKGTQTFSKNKIINLVQKSLRRLNYYFFQKKPKAFYRKNQLLDFDFEVAFSHYMFDDILNSPNLKSKKLFWFHGDLRNSGFTVEENNRFVHQMAQFDAGVFVSRFSKNIIKKTWGVVLNNSKVIFNLMPINEILEKSKQTQQDFGTIDFVSVGRLFHQKGFKDLLSAHIRLIKEGYPIKTLLIGEGNQRAELEKTIQDNNVSDSFILGGYQQNPYFYIRTASCFILPSYSEGYPLVIAESLLLETYVLSTSVGGIPELIESKDEGILFPPGPEHVYNAMKKVLTDRNFLQKNSDAKQKIVNRNQHALNQLYDLFS